MGSSYLSDPTKSVAIYYDGTIDRGYDRFDGVHRHTLHQAVCHFIQLNIDAFVLNRYEPFGIFYAYNTHIRRWEYRVWYVLTGSQERLKTMFVRLPWEETRGGCISRKEVEGSWSRWLMEMRRCWPKAHHKWRCTVFAINGHAFITSAFGFRDAKAVLELQKILTSIDRGERDVLQQLLSDSESKIPCGRVGKEIAKVIALIPKKVPRKRVLRESFKSIDPCLDEDVCESNRVPGKGLETNYLIYLFYVLAMPLCILYYISHDRWCGSRCSALLLLRSRSYSWSIRLAGQELASQVVLYASNFSWFSSHHPL